MFGWLGDALADGMPAVLLGALHAAREHRVSTSWLREPVCSVWLHLAAVGGALHG